MAKKRKDECLFCSSRKCNHRIVSMCDNGEAYDEIACDVHERELATDSNRANVKLLYITKLGKVKRGESFYVETYGTAFR